MKQLRTLLEAAHEAGADGKDFADWLASADLGELISGASQLPAPPASPGTVIHLEGGEYVIIALVQERGIRTVTLQDRESYESWNAI